MSSRIVPLEVSEASRAELEDLADRAPQKTKAPRLRPGKLSVAVTEEICERLAKGEPLAQICRDVHMPVRQKVYEWANADPELAGRIAHAREIGFDAIADECLAIADGSADHNRDRLRVDTRLKLLSKWDPKRYGEKLGVEHTGTIGFVRAFLLAAE